MDARRASGASAAAASRLAMAGIASAGAGLLHAAAAGIHAEHAGLARLFVGLAIAQLAVAVLGFTRPDRLAALALVAVNAAAVAGWIVTRLWGISWIGGLEVAERPQLADSISALLAAIAVLAAIGVVFWQARPLPPGGLTMSAVLATLLLGPGLVNATNHDHGGHSHDEAASDVSGAASDGHDHAHADDGAAGSEAVAAATSDAGTHTHEASATNEPAKASATSESGDHAHADDVATRPYDPTQPIDLGGVSGVTPEQQAFAENLVAATVRDLPQWADLDVVEAAGFRSIGDAGTGHEHYIQWDWIEDDVWLDPDHPESLVFEPQPDGSKKLVSAMFMLPSSMTLDDVPDYGGALMQWHVHGDLCFTADHDAPQVAGLKPVGGTCQAPLVDFPLAPMIHVWITPTRCGPFAALEGIAGGQVPEGEQVLCDHVHGSG